MITGHFSGSDGAALFQPWYGGQMELCRLSEVESKLGIVGFS